MGEAYVVVNGIELGEVEKKVNDLIAQGYSPQPMVVAAPVAGATSRPRYVVPMINSGIVEACRMLFIEQDRDSDEVTVRVDIIDVK